MNFLTTAIKHAVSQNRNRFVDKDYDLDLTYITNRIIAMGFPGDGIRGLYRNDGQKISRFLKQYHNDHFMIFNLSQLEYEKDKFDNNIMPMGWPDHHNPPLDLLFSIMKTMHAWLSSDKNNVAVVHCLAGKGRTGTVIVCYLLYIGMFQTVDEALEYFAMKRTSSRNVDVGSLACVDSPSQLTYVNYFHQIITKQVNHDDIIKSKPILLNAIYLHNVPNFMITQIESGRFSLHVCQMDTLAPNETKLVPLLTFKKPYSKESRHSSMLTFKCDIPLLHDVVIVCKIANTLTVDEVFRFAFHTAFIQDNRLKKNKYQMDNSLKNSLIGADFMVELHFDTPATTSPAELTGPSKQEVVDLDGDDENVSGVESTDDAVEDPILQTQRLLYSCNISEIQGKKKRILLNHEVVAEMEQEEHEEGKEQEELYVQGEECEKEQTVDNVETTNLSEELEIPSEEQVKTVFVEAICSEEKEGEQSPSTESADDENVNESDNNTASDENGEAVSETMSETI